MIIDTKNSAIKTSSRITQENLFSLLQKCNNSIKKFTQIHTQIIIHNFTQKNFIIVKLLYLYITSNLPHARKIFETVQNPSTNVCNQMIRGCCKSPMKNREFFEIYDRMVRRECETDGFTHSYVLSGCARFELMREAEQIHGRILRNGYCSNVFVMTNLINLYGVTDENGDMKRAIKVFEEMSVRNVVSWNTLLKGCIRCEDFDRAVRVFDEMPERDVVSWTTMIAGCAQNGKCKQAISLFYEMKRAGVNLDQVALVAVLSACAELGDLRLGQWIHVYVEDKLRKTNQTLIVDLQNALVHMYASCGMIEKAHKVFNEMKHRTTVSWTSMIVGYAKQGLAEQALALFQSMQNSKVIDVRPDDVTFIGVLSACSHAGLVDEGCHYFKFMNTKYGINPRIEHYGCMVDLLSRAGLLDEAYNLIQCMPMKPNGAVWRALLGGCKIHKYPELASHVAQNLTMETDTDEASGYFVLLSNVYAMATRWEDVSIVRRKMLEMGLKKLPGQSWIQINGIIHDFVSNDENHEDASVIYERLCELTNETKWEGYTPNWSELLLDAT